MATYERRRYLLMTTDPVHVGTGGYRLGRVDNSILREPGTRLPKIPGSSLHGAIRSHAARLYENLAAAGQDHSGVQAPENDPVCYTFGYIRKAKDDETEAAGYAGVANVFDAHITFFPVYSMAGPVWVTVVDRLVEAGFAFSSNAEWTDKRSVVTTMNRAEPLNLGWLMVNPVGDCTISPPAKWENEARWKTIKDRIVVVKESLFSHIVNSGLEVRTSVSINPQTGAAKVGALFTYEALPKATFLTMEIVFDDYRAGGDGAAFKRSSQGKTCLDNALPGGAWHGPADVVEAGLRALEWLGVGGMGTRGFGRLSLSGEPVSIGYGEEAD